MRSLRSVKLPARVTESDLWQRLRDARPFRERNPITVGVVSVTVLVVLMMFAFSLNSFPFLRGVYSIQADFADAAGVTPENEVVIAGLKVGKVKSIELLAPDDNSVYDRVRMVLELASDVHIGTASEAEVKLKTILGAKFVEIEPRGTQRVEPGETIPLRQTRIPFEFYEVTNRTVDTLGEIDAKALNDALRELGDLTEDPDGNLGRALEGLADASEGLGDSDAEMETVIRSGRQILDVLRSRSQALGRILESGGKLLSALGARRDALASFVSGTDQLSSQLSSLLASTRGDLDPALRDLHTTLEVVKKDLGPVERAIKSLGPAAKGFGTAFTQGNWGDIWLQSVLDIPLPPILPGGLPSGTGTGSSIVAEAAR